MKITKLDRTEELVEFFGAVANTPAILEAFETAGIDIDVAEYIDYFKGESKHLIEKAAKDKVKRQNTPRKESEADKARRAASEKNREMVLAVLAANADIGSMSAEDIIAAGKFNGVSRNQITTFCTQLVKAGKVVSEPALINGAKRTVYTIAE